VIETASPSTDAHHHRSASGGLSATTVVVLVTLVTLITGLVSAATGRGFGIAFNVIYLVITLYAALRIHVSSRWYAVVAPPLIYALTLGVAGFFDTEETSHTLRRVIENSFVNLSFGGPWLTGATLAALVIVLIRGRRDKVVHHRTH
jgi:hypothetical protein